MSFSFGNILKISLFGESHSKAIGMSIDGLPAGLEIDQNLIEENLIKRLGEKSISTPRRENDCPEFIGGVFNGKTTGGPVAFILENKDVNSSSYLEGQIRPSHADLTLFQKFNGFNDYRGGGFSSGRMTACFVVLGSICSQILNKYNIVIETNIKSIKDETSPLEMRKIIEDAMEHNDSVGGITETKIFNCPIGLGEPYFDSFESSLSHLLFSLGGIKGIEFGDGFDLTKKFGSEVKDELRFSNNKIEFLSNHNGGINGGITNGQPIIFRCAIKPTPSFCSEQKSINIKTGGNVNLKLNGRYDPCFVHRVIPVIDSIVAYLIVELLMEKESKNI